jgi:hypothetical protein
MANEATQATTHGEDDFLAFPIHKVVSGFEDQATVDAAIDDLLSHGFKADDIEGICGVDGERRMDFAGTNHGTLTTFLRNLQHIGPDRQFLERYEQYLRDGHCLIMVTVHNKLRRNAAAQILHKHTDQKVTYFGLLAISDL